MFRWILILVFLSLATPAFAIDGVLEINQTCATQTGCFAGDAAGFPVTITASGSYRLTSGLVIPDPYTGAIAISIKNVIIDLNAFSIVGPTVCTGVCAPTGAGDGIFSIQENVSVRNGSVVSNGGSTVSGGVAISTNVCDSDTICP